MEQRHRVVAIAAVVHSVYCVNLLPSCASSNSPIPRASASSNGTRRLGEELGAARYPLERSEELFGENSPCCSRTTLPTPLEPRAGARKRGPGGACPSLSRYAPPPAVIGTRRESEEMIYEAAHGEESKIPAFRNAAKSPNSRRRTTRRTISTGRRRRASPSESQAVDGDHLAALPRRPAHQPQGARQPDRRPVPVPAQGLPRRACPRRAPPRPRAQPLRQPDPGPRTPTQRPQGARRQPEGQR